MAITFVGQSVKALLGSGTTVVFDRPAGIEAGDLLIALTYCRGNRTWTPASGFGVIRELAAQARLSDFVSLAASWKVATASEPSQWSFLLSGSATRRSGMLAMFRGADQSPPVGSAIALAGWVSPYPVPAVADWGRTIKGWALAAIADYGGINNSFFPPGPPSGYINLTNHAAGEDGAMLAILDHKEGFEGSSIAATEYTGAGGQNSAIALAFALEESTVGLSDTWGRVPI